MATKQKHNEGEPNILSPEQMEKTVARLMSKRSDVRFRAAHALMAAGRPALARAIELTLDERPRMRDMAATILGQAGGNDHSLPGQDRMSRMYYREGVSELLRLMEQDPVADVRESAACALGFQAVPETLPALCRSAFDPSEQVRFGVAYALGCFFSGIWEEESAAPYRGEVTATLLRLMDDKSSHVRDWATFGMHQGGHNTPEVRARLWKALEDTDPDVRGEAAEGLAIFGDISLLPRLMKLLQDKETMVPLYFSAARELGDPSLLPVVEEAAAYWRHDLKPGEELEFDIRWALERLREAKEMADRT